ncbi:hypothetical protein FGO68_gene6102 [Halteria grandinella]|uniref:Uncharacterized protein n=1 Tax=Halteria grandinella TaxID=5974 RepID=A0A8J8NH27_HALGN|nr:hypothetical protein FGO68_gene6102 [Halteria grandinella]
MPFRLLLQPCPYATNGESENQWNFRVSYQINHVHSYYVPQCLSVPNDNCYERRLAGDEGCINCIIGYKFQLKDALLQTGSCVPGIVINTVTSQTLTVLGGARNAAYSADGGTFIDLLSALKYAYTLHRDTKAEHVIIKLDPSLDHYVTPQDFERVYPLYEDKYLIAQDYSLTIMPFGCEVDYPCQTKVTVRNKIGARLRIYMPVHNKFVIKNVMLDSIDSVLDQSENDVVKNCLNDVTVNCCKVDTSLQIIKCNDSYGNTLMPKFHIESSCYSKPVTGALFHLQIADPQYKFQSEYRSEVKIQVRPQSLISLIIELSVHQFFL